MYKRILDLSKLNSSFFLWGPRQSGKSFLLKTTFPSSLYVDLLHSEVFIKYQRAPEALGEEIIFLKSHDKLCEPVIIDEIQKVPLLLDEVHSLIENQNVRFGLCGSSARKVRKGHANLLGGRALRFELTGLSAKELGQDFDLKKMLNRGFLPRLWLLPETQYRHHLRAYCADYLKEEIAAESLTRNLPSFAQFLDVASLSCGEVVEFATIAREIGVSAPTVRNYFELLVDTLMGQWLPAYRKRPKRRTVQSPKFYFDDLGVVNCLAKRGKIELGSELSGKAFEHWVYHELNAFRNYVDPDLLLSYWRLSSKIEVDFILGDLVYAIEAKCTKRIRPDHFKGLRALKEEYPQIKHRVLVCLVDQPRKTNDGILVLPYQDFIEMLWNEWKEHVVS